MLTTGNFLSLITIRSLYQSPEFDLLYVFNNYLLKAKWTLVNINWDKVEVNIWQLSEVNIKNFKIRDLNKETLVYAIVRVHVRILPKF